MKSTLLLLACCLVASAASAGPSTCMKAAAPEVATACMKNYAREKGPDRQQAARLKADQKLAMAQQRMLMELTSRGFRLRRPALTTGL